MGLITLENVSKIYEGDVRALDDVSLEIKHGEWVSIMGPSGSGKSTMLNLIGCMDTPSLGTVKIDGIDISQLNKKELTKVRREKIGLVFQQFHLIPYLTAVENVMVAQYYHSMADEDEALKALERVGLGHRANHLPKELSGGEQQRVCIARALINYPKLILADEPTGNLDKENERIVLDLFEELHEQGHSIMLVTHDPKVGQLAERQINLEYGKLAK
ncbi:ABC transporter ATP-binding protein [Orenia marismortui]|uniref:Putative ABC transport system ATP-binding protein n=1 Tax=Orenia marismortui TaxID=46469 RepID=A0A4R8H379_9FIRM|nr:ABC transporter ATP-binding protein [Orenia marismortui]TDX48942.1 putative ABC transport system ATP-binding protein [Orenia marismortui]